MSVTVHLPWPPRSLWPNGGHGNRYAKAAAKAAYKRDCMWTAKADGLRRTADPKEPVTLAFVFHGATRGRYDIDNALAASKASIDAISDVLGVDDSLFGFELWRGEPVNGGRVSVTITPTGGERYERRPRPDQTVEGSNL